MLHEYKTDSKRTWHVMKKITGKQKTKSNFLPQEIKVDETIIKNPQAIAKVFNKFFYLCWIKIGKKKSPTLKKISRLFDIS